jgi:hypothetical protein
MRLTALHCGDAEVAKLTKNYKVWGAWDWSVARARRRWVIAPSFSSRLRWSGFDLITGRKAVQKKTSKASSKDRCALSHLAGASQVVEADGVFKLQPEDASGEADGDAMAPANLLAMLLRLLKEFAEVCA